MGLVFISVMIPHLRRMCGFDQRHSISDMGEFVVRYGTLGNHKDGEVVAVEDEGNGGCTGRYR